MKFRLASALAGAAMALATLASAPVAAQEKAVFGFPSPPNVQFAYLWFGSKLGFFKEEGLQLDVISVTGSAVLPIKSLLMNILTLASVFGILVFVFQDGNLSGVLDFESIGGLDLSTPILIFAITFGLSTDYAVFLLSRR